VRLFAWPLRHLGLPLPGLFPCAVVPLRTDHGDKYDLHGAET
jgi:hypothetical protein